MASTCPSLARQRGATLLTGLIFLIALMLIGVTAARVSMMEERMAGNMRDRSIAMQAAELALRDAERDILDLSPAPVGDRVISGLTHFATDCNEDGDDGTTDDGLCYAGSGGYADPIWSTVDMTDWPSVEYGTFTGAPAIAGVSAQPRYVIEGIVRRDGGTDKFFYRITARAQGANANTVVMLQELFRP